MVESMNELHLDSAPEQASVRPLTSDGWPEGYAYGATRHADVILRQAFPERYADLASVLDSFQPTLDELRTGGGGRTVFVKRFDDSLAERGASEGSRMWGKQNITIEKRVSIGSQEVALSRVRGHEIDMFGIGSIDNPLPGVAVEMEWNNKDPFFDRDLVNFQALHREGAIAVGVIVTRGPELQELISPTIRSKDGGFKYGLSSTHWNKLVPRVNLGGGGECPLLLIGIEPARVVGIELAQEVRREIEDAEIVRSNWRELYGEKGAAVAESRRLRDSALSRMPPLSPTSDTP